MRMTPIDNGFFRISAADARRLAGGKLPRHGREMLVEYDGKHYWISRANVGGETVWAIRETVWRLVNGRAVL